METEQEWKAREAARVAREMNTVARERIARGKAEEGIAPQSTIEQLSRFGNNYDDVRILREHVNEMLPKVLLNKTSRGVPAEEAYQEFFFGDNGWVKMNLNHNRFSPNMIRRVSNSSRHYLEPYLNQGEQYQPRSRDSSPVGRADPDWSSQYDVNFHKLDFGAEFIT